MNSLGDALVLARVGGRNGAKGCLHGRIELPPATLKSLHAEHREGMLDLQAVGLSRPDQIVKVTQSRGILGPRLGHAAQMPDLVPAAVGDGNQAVEDRTQGLALVELLRQFGASLVELGDITSTIAPPRCATGCA